MACKKLSRRKGTTDFGKTYEHNIAALLGVKSVLSDDVEDMWIATNVDKVGAFDDLVLFLQKRCGSCTKKEMYLIQIKYRKNKTLNLSSEETSLYKYQESYLQIREDFRKGTSPLTGNCEFEDLRFLLFTNKEIKIPQGTAICEPGNVDDLINTGKMFQISNVTDNLYNEDFLKQTYFYYNQINVSKIESIMKREIDKYFTNCNVEQIVKFFENWHSEAYEDKAELSIEDIRSILLELVLSRHVPVPRVAAFSKAHIWNETTSQFRFLFLEEDHLSEVWQAVQLQIHYIFEDQHINLCKWSEKLENPSDKIRKAKEYSLYQNYPILKDKHSYTVKDLYFLLYHMCKLPLIVNLNANTNEYEEHEHKRTQTIRLALTKLDPSRSRRRYIIIGQMGTDFLQNYIPFNIKRYIQEKLQKNLCLHLQGKEVVTLEELDLNKAAWESITPDIFIELLKIDANEVLINDTYIPRFLRQPLVAFNAFTMPNTVFIVATNGSIHDICVKLNKWRPTVPWHIYEHADENLRKTATIIVTKDPYGLKRWFQIKTVINNTLENTNQTIHYLRILEDGSLKWLYSNTNAESIKPFLISIPTTNLPDTELFGYLTFNILSANAGEGKSTLLQFVADHCNPDIWVIQINMTEVTEYIETDEFSEIKKFLYDHSKGTLIRYKEFSWELFQCLYNQRKMIAIIDGIDELEWNTKIEHFLSVIKSMEIKTIIATRPSLNDILEKKFNTFSLFLEPFTPSDCQELIKLSLNDNYNNVSDSQIASAIQRISSWDNMVGVPLLLTLFVSLLKDGCLPNVDQFDITDLFDAFINEQLNKVGSLCKSTIRTLSRLALFMFYNEQYLSQLFSMEDYFEDMEEKIEIYVKCKLIQKINNRVLMFAHKSLAEFLVAKYLMTKVVQKRDSVLINSFLESLFYKELETVRLFFDVMVLKDSPLQRIITSSNQTNLYKDFKCNLVDRFGRNALHIASSYGLKCDLKDKKLLWPGVKIYESYNIIHVQNFVQPSQKSERTTLLTLDLLNKISGQGFDPLQKDNLFKTDTIDFGTQSGSLTTIKVHVQNVLQPSQKSERRTVVSLDLFREILRQGFDPLQKDNLFKMDTFDFAIQSGSLGMIEVLYSENYFKDIENVNHDILLYFSVRDGYVNIFKRLQNRNFKLKTLPVYENLLHVALRKENLEIIHELANNMRNIDEPNQVNYTPLTSWLASSIVTDSNEHLTPLSIKISRFNENQLKILHLLIEKGANVNRVNAGGETPLHVLCRSQDKSVVETLIKNGAEVNMKTYQGDIPLHYAAQYSIENVKVLVNHKSEIDTSNNFGFTPLCCAARSGQLDIVKYLISRKALTNRSKNQVNPLNAAVIGGYVDCIKFLLNKHAKINNTNTDNTLVYAILFSDLDCLKLLIQEGAKVDKGLLFVAINFNRKDVIKYFLSEKLVDVSVCKDHPSPLFTAVAADSTDLVQTFIEFGADVNVKNSEMGDSPLHVASELGVSNMVELLIDRGAIVNAPDKNGCTPLFWAAQYGNFACLKILIDKGAMVNAENSNRHSALTVATENGHLECIKYLVNAGCNLQRYGHFALYLAAVKGHTDVVDYFCQLMV